MMKKSHKSSSDFSRRTSGILMHLSSLPGIHGSGDLGPESHRFAEQLEKAGQSWWQMLPIGPAGRAPSFSPYDSPSAFGGNPWFVSLTLLADEGLLTAEDLRPDKRFSKSGIRFDAVQPYREERLHKAFVNFIRNGGDRLPEYKSFCRQNGYWLEDFALFTALREEAGGRSWTEWPEQLRSGDPAALMPARDRLSGAAEYHKFVQFMFEQQWKALRKKCHSCGVGLIGDIPFFTAHDSSDVWGNQELFMLYDNGKPARISGYPPDRFNKDGQLWGHPQFEWANHLEKGFDWWVKRFSRMYELFDAVRIDHFLGFTRTWSVPGSSRTAKKGRWVRSPGTELFQAVEKKLGSLPMIAEDLGHVTPADIALRKAFGFLPMRIFQFGFGSEADSKGHLPHNLDPQCAAYTGNHDNDTIRGWLSKLPASQKRKVLAYTGGSRESFNLDAMRTLMASPANVVIFPVQDILGLGSAGRMNVPGTIHGNWGWRLKSALPAEVLNKMGLQTELFDRIRN